MKHIELILATFAGLAFAVPQNSLTDEEWDGKRVIVRRFCCYFIEKQANALMES